MFEWDPNKDRLNQRKHKVAFADTFAVFEDPNALTMEDYEQGEDRHATVGMDCFGRILVVVIHGVTKTSESYPLGKQHDQR